MKTEPSDRSVSLINGRSLLTLTVLIVLSFLPLYTLNSQDAHPLDPSLQIVDGEGFSIIRPGASSVRDIQQVVESLTSVTPTDYYTFDPGFLTDALRSWTLANPDRNIDDLINGLVAEHSTSDSRKAFHHYLAAAQSGDPAAMLFSGRALAYGYGTKPQRNQAESWFAMASEFGPPYFSAQADVELARLNSSMIGTMYEPFDTTELLLSAAEKHPTAIPNYVNHLVWRLGTQETSQDVSKWMNVAADYNNVSALEYLFKQGAADTRPKILETVKNINSPSSHTFLGDYYRNVDDFEQSLAAYQKAADRDPYALAWTARLVLENPALDEDKSSPELIADLRRAAREGEPLATIELSDRAVEPDRKYTLTIQAEDNDPSGRYAARILSNKGELCVGGHGKCLPVPVWYVTNRRFKDDQRMEFDNVPLKGGLHVGMAKVGIWTVVDPAPEQAGLVEYAFTATCKLVFGSSCTPLNPSTEVLPPSIVPWDGSLSGFLDELTSGVLESALPPIVIYVHGYNTSFASAAQRLALLVNRGRIRAIPVLFSWPSGDTPIAYSNESTRGSVAYDEDRVRVERSCRVFHHALSEFVRTFGGDRIHIVAHSMGTYLVHLISLGCDPWAPRSPEFTIKGVTYVASDLDVTTFRESYELFRAMSQHFTLYVTANDGVLSTSRWWNKQQRRLGTGGTGRFVADDAVTVDATTVEFASDADLMNHSYVFYVATVRRDLSHVLQGYYGTSFPRCLIPISDGGFYIDGC